jgi:AraC family transcriptional regulator
LLLVVVMFRRWADRVPPVLPAPSPDVHDPRVPLRYLTWPGVSAGFHAEADGAPEDGLLHAGETWAGGSWFVDRHEHPVWEFYLQSRGTTRWRVGEEVVAVPPGAFLAVPPSTPHSLASPPPSRHHFFYAALDAAGLVTALDPGGHADAAAPWSAAVPLHARHAQSLAAPFRALARELTAVRPWQRLGLRAAATLLVVEATRLVTAQHTTPDADSAAPPLPRPSTPAVRRARRLLDERYAERWRVADLAAGGGVSATHLAELFTLEVGLPPHRYLLERRLERAAELLATSDLPVTAIAIDVGLSRAFRAALGTSPREYRRSHRG